MRKRLSSFDWHRISLFCIPVVVATGVRGIGVALFFRLLATQGKISTPWMKIYGWNTIPNSSNWLWLFNAWDSFNFGLIATYGYQHPNYSYLPAYPLLIHLTGFLAGDYWFAGFLVTQIFALASLVMFQLTSELYMEPKEALCATLLMATFPFIIVFTTLGYSESLFFFATISSWYFYKKERLITSSLLAGVASVTRIYGIVILIPILLDMLKTRSWRLRYFAIPAALIATWLIYCFISTGDPFASWTDENYWRVWANGDTGIRYGLVPTILFQGLRGIVVCCAGGNSFDPAILVSVGLFIYLISKIWRVDKLLWTYAISLFSLMIFTAPIISVLRYLAFIFPIWLTVRLKNPLIVSICIAVFIPVTLVLWLYALLRNFIG